MVLAAAPQADPLHAYAPLLARGITQEALALFSVSLCTRYNYPYWRYPVWSAGGQIIAWRYKRAGDDSGRRKYDWGTEREPDPLWPQRACPAPRAEAVYNVVGLRAGEPAYLVAGEPDCWLMSSLGLSACSLLAGEGSPPRPAALDAIGARHPASMTVIYDHDSTGRQGAVTCCTALRSRGLAAVALALPEEVGPGGDLCDLYRLCGQDGAAFAGRLAALGALAPGEAAPEHAPRARPNAGRHTPSTAAGTSPIARFKARHDLLAVLESAGVELRSHQGGAYWQGRCPFHLDHSPSFVVWPQRGYWKCYGCGVRGDVLDFLLRQRAADVGAP